MENTVNSHAFWGKAFRWEGLIHRIKRILEGEDEDWFIYFACRDNIGEGVDVPELNGDVRDYVCDEPVTCIRCLDEERGDT